VYVHPILLEDDYKPLIEHQRRLNPNMNDVIKKKISKLIKVVIIYPTSDSKWVSPFHVVPKKRRMTVIKNKNYELICTMTIMGWRIRIDYRKSNKATP